MQRLKRLSSLFYNKPKSKHSCNLPILILHELEFLWDRYIPYLVLVVVVVVVVEVVELLKFCSWVQSSRATLYILSASTCNQQLLEQKFFILALFS